jgi:MGT family glycosyltransferase
MSTDSPVLDAASPRAFLFTHWEGGGNTPPMLALVRRLLARGHSVRVLSDPCNREEVEATGAGFASWTRAPHRADKTMATDPLRDWEVASPPALVGRLRDRLFIGPSLGHAQDVLEELKYHPASVVVSSEMLFGAMAAAEAARVPCIGLSANIYLFPRAGVPPCGPGLMPATSVVGRLRDWVVTTLSLREFGKGAAVFNDTRASIGLRPVRHPFDQLKSLERHLVLSSAAFDFPSTQAINGLVYAGAELEDPAWIGRWTSPWSATDPRPLVLVGFSTTFQNQAAALARVIDALRDLPVRAVVTTGPAIDAAALPSAANVHVCASAPHSVLLQDASAAITHCGHGTVIRALAAGVPLLCMPMGRDQNDNAARVVHAGAGVRLAPTAAADSIRASVQQLLATPRYRDAARRLGEIIVADSRKGIAVAELERVAQSSHAAVRRERAS